MLPPMKRTLSRLLLGLIFGFGIVSCMDSSEPKPVGPVSENSQIPWNTPVAGQGQGQFGALPQNQYRR